MGPTSFLPLIRFILFFFRFFRFFRFFFFFHFWEDWVSDQRSTYPPLAIKLTILQDNILNQFLKKINHFKRQYLKSIPEKINNFTRQYLKSIPKKSFLFTSCNALSLFEKCVIEKTFLNIDSYKNTFLISFWCAQFGFLNFFQYNLASYHSVYCD